ncbi:MAG TPA: hypothetical protein VIV59_12885, partial [Anaeromyxobacteraceae bacterium]
MTGRALLLLALLGAATPAAAQVTIPARGGELGILDVPDAEVLGRGNAAMGAELRFDHGPGLDQLGPLPIYAAAGLAPRLDLGFAVREGGQPGDPLPARVFFGAAAKLQLLRARGIAPALALSLIGDRLNERGVLGARLALSLTLGRARLAGFVGGEALADGFKEGGLTAGGAIALNVGPRLELAAEGLTGPRGSSYGGAIRYLATPTMALSLGVNHFPDDASTRFSFGVAFSPAPRPKVVKPAEPTAAPAPVEEEPTAVAAWEDRPRFRLKLHVEDPATLGEPRHLQNAPYTPPSVAGAPPRLTAPPRA